MPCTCSNPDCTLPPGRCFLCGVPTLHASTSGTEVCSPCADKVLEVYAAEQVSELTTPGWFLDTTDDEPSIVADDDMNRFETDEDAAEHVRRVINGEVQPEPYEEDEAGSCRAARETQRRPIHCPRCAVERGVAIPSSCPHVNSNDNV